LPSRAPFRSARGQLARGPRISGLFSMISKRNDAQGAGQPRAGPRFTARRARSAHNVHAPRRAGPPTSTQGPRTFGLGPRSMVFGPDLSIPNPEKEQNKVAKGPLARKMTGHHAPSMQCATRPDVGKRKRGEIFPHFSSSPKRKRIKQPVDVRNTAAVPVFNPHQERRRGRVRFD
jgi:hypothetical protein